MRRVTEPDLPTVVPGALTLSCDPLDARPLFWTEPDGTRHGYEPDAAAVVAERLGLSLRWRFVDWNDRYGAVERREADGVWCGIAVTPERAAAMRLTSPYAVFDEALCVRDDSPIRSVADVAGRRIGAIAGSTNLALAATWPGAVLVPFDGEGDDVFGQMQRAVRDGAIDGFVDDEPAFLDIGDGLRVAFSCATRQRWACALRPGGDEALASALDAAIESCAADGTLAAVWARTVPALPCPFPAS